MAVRLSVAILIPVTAENLKERDHGIRPSREQAAPNFQGWDNFSSFGMISLLIFPIAQILKNSVTFMVR